MKPGRAPAPAAPPAGRDETGLSRVTGQIDPALMAPIRRHLDRGTRRTLAPSAILIGPDRPASAFAYVVTGLIQSTLLRSTGEHVIVERIGPGSICGEGPCLHEEKLLVEMTALSPSEVVLFDRALMLSLFREDAEFALALARVVSLKYHRLLTRFGAFSDRRPAERLMELFTRLAQFQSERHAGGQMIRTRLTHEEIAGMTGLSRVTVTRTLARLRRAGRLDLIGDRYLLPDAAAAPSAADRDG